MVASARRFEDDFEQPYIYEPRRSPVRRPRRRKPLIKQDFLTPFLPVHFLWCTPWDLKRGMLAICISYFAVAMLNLITLIMDIANRVQTVDIPFMIFLVLTIVMLIFETVTSGYAYLGYVYENSDTLLNCLSVHIPHSFTLLTVVLTKHFFLDQNDQAWTEGGLSGYSWDLNVTFWVKVAVSALLICITCLHVLSFRRTVQAKLKERKIGHRILRRRYFHRHHHYSVPTDRRNLAAMNSSFQMNRPSRISQNH